MQILLKYKGLILFSCLILVSAYAVQAKESHGLKIRGIVVSATDPCDDDDGPPDE